MNDVGQAVLTAIGIGLVTLAAWVWLLAGPGVAL